MGGRLGLSMSMRILDSTLYYVWHCFLKGDTSRGVSAAALVRYDDFKQRGVVVELVKEST